MVCISEIQVTSDALRQPARLFGNKWYSFSIFSLVRTLFVTLYELLARMGMKLMQAKRCDNFGETEVVDH